jgi:Fe-S cluster biogenesis protein NfuA
VTFLWPLDLGKGRVFASPRPTWGEGARRAGEGLAGYETDVAEAFATQFLGRYSTGNIVVNITPEPNVKRKIEHLENLIKNLERLPDPAARDQARELVQTLLDVHGAAIAKLLEGIAGMGAPGHALISSLAGDDLVSSLLLLYGLHPLDLETRVNQALDQVRPYLRTHKGDVELVEVIDGVVRLRMQGSCHGCPSSAMTLKNAIEEAIYATAPDVTAIEVEGVVDPPVHPSHLLPIVSLDPRLITRSPAISG